MLTTGTLSKILGVQYWRIDYLIRTGKVKNKIEIVSGRRVITIQAAREIAKDLGCQNKLNQYLKFYKE